MTDFGGLIAHQGRLFVNAVAVAVNLAIALASTMLFTAIGIDIGLLGLRQRLTPTDRPAALRVPFEIA